MQQQERIIDPSLHPQEVIPSQSTRHSLRKQSADNEVFTVYKY